MSPSTSLLAPRQKTGRGGGVGVCLGSAHYLLSCALHVAYLYVVVLCRFLFYGWLFRKFRVSLGVRIGAFC